MKSKVLLPNDLLDTNATHLTFQLQKEVRVSEEVKSKTKQDKNKKHTNPSRFNVRFYFALEGGVLTIKIHINEPSGGVTCQEVVLVSGSQNSSPTSCRHKTKSLTE